MPKAVERIRASRFSDDDMRNDFEPLLKIDKDALDDALEQHPDLFYRVSKETALASSRADQAKTEIEETRAKLDMQLRKTAAENDEKITEGAIQQRITSSQAMQDAVTNHLTMRKEAALWVSLKDSFEQKSYAMKELVALYVAGYFGDAVNQSSQRTNRDRLAEDNKARAGQVRRQSREE